jgi:hypothetical protein
VDPVMDRLELVVDTREDKFEPVNNKFELVVDRLLLVVVMLE